MNQGVKPTGQPCRGRNVTCARRCRVGGDRRGAQRRQCHEDGKTCDPGSDASVVSQRILERRDATGVFRAALASVPISATKRNKDRTRALIHGQLALACAGLGATAAARAELALGHHALREMTVAGAFDGFVTDASFGPAGINANLIAIEPGRDPRARIALASALLALHDGVPLAALDLVVRESATFQRSLWPHERALLSRIERESLRRIANQGMHRAPARIATTDEFGAGAAEWATAMLPEPHE